MKHSNGSAHKIAEENMKLWVANQKMGRVDQQLDSAFRDSNLITQHKEHLLTVLDIIIFCCEQEIALRGDDESTDSENRGNFLALLEFLSKYDPRISKRLARLPLNATMISPDIQNDLLECSKRALLEQIIGQVKDSIYVCPP